MNKIEWLILLLQANDYEPIKGITKFEKLLFYYLKKQNMADIALFQFQPYNFGPHSDDIRDLLYALRDNGIIEITPRETDNFLEIDDVEEDQEELLPINYNKQESYNLTQKGKEVAKKVMKKFDKIELLNSYKKKFNRMSLTKLIQIVCLEYPDMAINSKIKGIIGVQ